MINNKYEKINKGEHNMKISIDSLFFCLEQLSSDTMLEIIEDDDDGGYLIVIPKDIKDDIKQELKHQNKNEDFDSEEN